MTQATGDQNKDAGYGVYGMVQANIQGTIVAGKHAMQIGDLDCMDQLAVEAYQDEIVIEQVKALMRNAHEKGILGLVEGYCLLTSLMTAKWFNFGQLKYNRHLTEDRSPVRK